MTIANKTVVELCSEVLKIVRNYSANQSKFDPFSSLDFRKILLSADSSVDAVQLSLLEQRIEVATEMARRSLSESKPPQHFIYCTDLTFDMSIWKPLRSSSNHSLRYQHFYTLVIIEMDWKPISLRCGRFRYRFFFNDKVVNKIRPIFSTDHEKIAQLYIDRVECIDFGYSLDEFTNFISLFVNIRLIELTHESGEILTIGLKKNLCVEVSEFIVIGEITENTILYTSDPYPRDTLNLLNLISIIFDYRNIS